MRSSLLCILVVAAIPTASALAYLGDKGECHPMQILGLPTTFDCDYYCDPLVTTCPANQVDAWLTYIPGYCDDSSPIFCTEFDVNVPHKVTVKCSCDVSASRCTNIKWQRSEFGLEQNCTN